MDQFLETLIFILPGLFGYYWLQVLGQTPSQKYNNFEMLSISTLLWVPIVTIFLLIHNFILCKIKGLKVIALNNTGEIIEATNNFKFVIYFLISTIIIGFIVALIWVYLSKCVLSLTNVIRKKWLNYAELSKGTSVWEEIFNVYGPKVVEIAKLDKPEISIIGSLTKSSRALELERCISINEVDYFTKLVQKKKPAISHIFIDLKAGLMIKVFNWDDIKKAQLEYPSSFLEVE